MRSVPHSILVGYGSAVLALTLATVVRSLLTPIVGDFYPFPTFTAAVAFAVWIGGLGPGVFALVGGALLANHYFSPPLDSLWLPYPWQWVGFTLYVGSSSLIIMMAHSLRRHRQSAEDQSRRLAATLRQSEATEGALRASEERFRQLADSMPQLVWTANADGTVDYFNHRVADFEGFGRNEDGSWTWQPVLHPDDTEITVAAWHAALAAGRPYQFEHRVRLADGSWRWHLSRAVPVRDAAENIIKWYGTATDIHDLKLTQGALQEADHRKDEFLATLGHELRNPLAPIRNAVEFLKLKGAADPAVQAAQDVIDRQVLYMVRLIDDLLDVSRITRGKLRLRSERVELARVIDQALEIERPLIARAGHDLVVSLPPQPIFLDADPVRLAQVFSNLLNNAGKYTQRGGCIRLSAAPGNGEVVVTVADSGIGILPDQLPCIFDMFAQAQSASEQSRSGLGVGLSLTRALVEMHGGGIEARSDGPGKGSEFVVRLPVLQANAAAHAAQADTPAPGESSPGRILVADDNRDAAESLAMLLRLHGNEVITARDGVDAVTAAERFHPDLVLLDLGMPKLDGYGACQRMREQSWGKDTLIVAVTGWGQDSDRRKSRDAGFDGHLVKPIAASAVLELCNQLQTGKKPDSQSAARS